MMKNTQRFIHVVVQRKDLVRGTVAVLMEMEMNNCPFDLIMRCTLPPAWTIYLLFWISLNASWPMVLPPPWDC